MSNSPTSQHIVRSLADDSRRKIVAALVLHDGACATSDIAAATGLAVRDIVEGLDRLVTAGLVEQLGAATDSGYQLLGDVFQHAARAEAPPAPPSEHGDQPDDVARVLDLAIKDGKLVAWPSKRTKRLIVLDHLAQQFDIGKRYNEAEVNDRLRPYNDDVATMRRYLVDEQFLDRGNGDYWRCGGSF